MKYLALPLIVLLSACSSTNNHRSTFFMQDMLDTAPKSNTELRNPEWGYTSRNLTTGVQVPASNPQREVGAAPQTNYEPTVKNVNTDSLQSFLLKNGVDYEVLPGNHIMVKLKDTVKFKTGSSRVIPHTAQWLNLIGRYLSSQPDINVVIDGHSDSTGSARFNDGLSERRAKAVKQQLVQNRVSENAIFTRGYGEHVPSCSNATSSGKACNRRVELLLIVSDK